MLVTASTGFSELLTFFAVCSSSLLAVLLTSIDSFHFPQNLFFDFPDSFFRFVGFQIFQLKNTKTSK